MGQQLSVATLTPLLEGQPNLIAAALAEIYADQPLQLHMDAVEANAAQLGWAVVDLLVTTLERHETAGRFVAYLRARNVDLLPPDAHSDPFDPVTTDLGDITIGKVTKDNFDVDNLAKFTRRCKAFRCRVKVGGQVVGSGAFVSPRLVLTAAHVVQAIIDAVDEDTAPDIEILAADNLSYPARKAFAVPCHPNEHTGGFPPQDKAEDFIDVALLRVDRPLGRLYGQVELPIAPVDWVGPARFILVHFPRGQEKGISIGRVHRDTPNDLREPHSILADKGSSGGPGFSREFAFLGIHQGRLGNFRRIVPYDRFIGNPDFQAQLSADKPPRYQWSIDGSLDSHLIIGRNLFFDALTAMIEGSAPLLRGIWLRRTNLNITTGLSFSFDILEGFLQAHEAPHKVFRISPSMGTEDLVSDLHAIVFGNGEVVAEQGVDEGQTTDVAHDEDRVRALLDAMQAEAAAQGVNYWVYVDNPPSGIRQDTQIQLEHIIEGLVLRPNIRIVISGFETYEFLLQLFESVGAARGAHAPSLLVEFLGGFRSRDVEQTATEMARALGIRWSADLISHFAKRSLRGLNSVAGGTFAATDLPEVSTRLRDFAKEELE